MFYTYILYSSKSQDFYYGSTDNLKERFNLHNRGKVKSTAPYVSWRLVCYIAFEQEKIARNFERYLKTGSGKAFAYKRLLNSEVLKKDKRGDKVLPKL